MKKYIFRNEKKNGLILSHVLKKAMKFFTIVTFFFFMFKFLVSKITFNSLEAVTFEISENSQVRDNGVRVPN